MAKGDALKAFIAQHRDVLTVAEGGTWGNVHVVGNAALAGFDHHLVVELDGAVFPVPLDESFWATPAEPPTPVGIVQAIDVASYQPRDVTTLVRELGCEGVIVRLYLPAENPSQDHSLAQIASAQAAGCVVGGYMWCYPDLDPHQSVIEALALAERAGLNLPVLWLDLETYEGAPGPNALWLRRAIAQCEANGVQAGFYTAKWYWDAYMPGFTEFGTADVPLWAAVYEDLPQGQDLDHWVPFGGWGHLTGKQWTSTPVDRNVMLASAFTS